MSKRKRLLLLCAMLCSGVPRAVSIVEAQSGLFDADTMLDVSQVRAGMKGYGKSVFQGTTVESFGITVLGVLKRMDAGGDAILIRVDDGPVVSNGYGIISGMSGSPIYVDDKLIGALAFGWSFSKEPIAGVTPIRQMLNAFSPGGESRVASTGNRMTFYAQDGLVHCAGKWVSTLEVRQRIQTGEVFAGEDTLVMQPVSTPLMAGGMSPSGIRRLKSALEPFNVVPVAAPGGKGPEVNAPLEPGSAVGVQLMTGDMDLTAIGTVTALTPGGVLAFGHSFLGMGSLEAPMTTAYIHGVVSRSESSFKLGSASQPVGTVTEDRTWCIGGTFGKRPDLLEALYQITDKDRGVARRLGFQVIREKFFAPVLLLMAVEESLNNVLSPVREGTTETRVRVKPEGLPEIVKENVFASGPGDASFSFGPSGPQSVLMEALDLLTYNRFRRVSVERVELEASFTTHREDAVIEKAFPERTRVKPGDEIDVTLHLRPYEKPTAVRKLKLRVPPDLHAGVLRVVITGGELAERLRMMLGMRPFLTDSLEQEIQLFQEEIRNDRIVVLTILPDVGLEMRGCQLSELPLPYLEVLRGAPRGAIRVIRDGAIAEYPESAVIHGLTYLTLVVEPEETEKSGTFAPFGGDMSFDEGTAEDILEAGRMGLYSQVDSSSPSPLRRWFGGDRPLEPELRLAVQQLVSQRTSAEEAAKKETLDLESAPAMPLWEDVEKIEPNGDDVLDGDGISSPASRKGKSLARPPTVWEESTTKDFIRGKADRTAMRSDGRIVLSSPTSTLFADAELYPMCQTIDAAGNVIVGTWLVPEVVRIDPAGKASVLLSPGTGAAVTAVARVGDAILAGESPSGILHRLKGDGSSEAVCKLPNSMIWSIADAGDSGVLVGTGSSAEVYLVSRDGKWRSLAQLPDRHALSIVKGPDGVFYCLTHPRGRVYRLKLTGEVESVFEPSKLGALSITTDSEGNLFVGTTPRGYVYRVDAKGHVKELFKSREKHVFGLVVADGYVYAGTGPRGNVYKIGPDGVATTVYSGKNRVVTSLQRDNNNAVVATKANANEVLRIQQKAETWGSFTSQVHEAAALSKWGRIGWAADVPTGASVTAQTRSGNTAFPDQGWSDWSKPSGESRGDTVQSPPGRYVQYRLNLFPGEGGASPSVSRVELIYMTANREPELEIKSPRLEEHLASTAFIRWSAKDPDKDKLRYSVYYSSDEGRTWTDIKDEKSKENTDNDATTIDLPGDKEMDATDPDANGDDTPEAHPGVPLGNVKEGVSEAKADEALEGGRPDDEPDSDNGETDIETSFSSGGNGQTRKWDTSEVPDGAYLIKVVATDEISNPTDARAAEKVSGPVVVDNTPPQVEMPPPFESAPTAAVSVRCEDNRSRVTGVEYRIDEGDWVAAAAADGVFDATAEEALIKSEHVIPGKHSLQVRCRDLAGNESVCSVSYSFGEPAGEGKAQDNSEAEPTATAKPSRQGEKGVGKREKPNRGRKGGSGNHTR